MTGKVGILAILAAAVAGPAAAVVWPSTVKWAVVIGYEIVLVVIGLLGGIFNDLKKRWQTRVTDLMDQALSRRLSRFEKRYREYVLSSLRFIDLKGLTTIGFYTPDLDEVFVDVSLDYRAPHQVQTGLLTGLPADAEARHFIGDFLGQKDPAVLAVLGAPGSGKTTLLRHTARRVFESKHRSVPVLLYLRDHVSQIASEPGISLPVLLRRTLGSHIEPEPAGWFEQKLRDGACVVLLDGLDEVAREEDRVRVADWVDLQIRRHPNNDYVLTSRPHGYRSAPIEGATVLQVRSFTDQQVRKFVHGWYVAVERHTTSGTAEEVQRKASAEAEDLLSRLHQSPALADLTVNPLLLTMIANVHRYRGALPGSRAELYGEICQVMLWRRQEAKKLSSDLSGDKKETLLRGLAYAMMQRQVRDLETKDVLEELRVALRRLPRKVTAAEFLADAGSNGLLVERESGQFSFAHHTFQEFLAAGHIREKGLIKTLTENVDDVWWRETTLLYTARSDADAIVKACLGSGSVTALSLAFDCMEQDSDIEPDLRTKLEELITEALVPGSEPDRRRLAAAVIVTRHLRHTVRTGSNGRVCPEPITNKIYHLFRQDIPGLQPDSPGSFPTDDTAVRGVRRRDAADFVRWVNRQASGEHEYRLPTEDEVAHPAVRRTFGSTPHSAWIHASRPTLWIPPKGPDPRVVEPRTHVQYVSDDLQQSSHTLARFFVLHAVNRSQQVAHHDAGRLGSAIARTLDDTRDGDLDAALDRSFTYASTNTSGTDWINAYDLARRVDQLLRSSRSPQRMQEAINETIQLALGTTNTGTESELDRLLCVDRERIHSAANNIGFNAGSQDMSALIGIAMSQVVAMMVRLPMARKDVNGARGRQPTDEIARFNDALTIVSDSKAFGRILDLDDMATVAEDACQPLLVPGASSPWVRQVAYNFVRAAYPIFARTEPLQPEKATALRLTALCLAVEADHTASKDVSGNELRRFAAGVTLLQRRASGHSPVTETILLATD